MFWLRDELAARGRSVRMSYGDKLAGDVLVLALDDQERDLLVEITVTRRAKGYVHLTALATTERGALAAREAMSRLHLEISRLANAKRKFVHRIDRLLDRLVLTWKEPQGDVTARRDQGLTRLRTVRPEAVAMNGVGFHVEVAGVEDRHTRQAYPKVHGAAIQVDDRWRAVAWEPRSGYWLMGAAVAVELQRSSPGIELAQGGVAIVDPSLVGAAAALGAAALLAGAAGSADEQDLRKKHSDGWDCQGGCDACDACDLLSWLPDLSDLGNCVPDCDSCDLGGFDCG